MKLLILLILTFSLFASTSDQEETLYRSGIQASRDFLKAMLPTIREVAAESRINTEGTATKISHAARLNALDLLDKALEIKEPEPKPTCMNQTVMIGLMGVAGIISSLVTYWWLK